MNEAKSPNRYSLLGLEVDDATLEQLLEMTRRHCKLALEHGKAQTSSARRREIHEEIETLRCERETIIARLRSLPIIRHIA